METLNQSQKLEILQEKPSKSIQNARDLESRLRVFTEFLEKEDLKNEYGFADIVKFWSAAFGEDKTKRVLEFVRTPLNSVELTENIINELTKVFNPKNGFWIVKTSQENQGEMLREESKKLKSFIEEGFKNATKNKPSMCLVVDFDGSNDHKLINLNSDQVHAAKVKKDGQFIYIAFTHSYYEDGSGNELKRFAFYDSTTYSTYIQNQDGTIVLESEIEHGLGYCPAYSYYLDPVNNFDNYTRKTPMTSALGKIDEWQLFDIYNFIQEHYGSMVISERVVDPCQNPNCMNGKERVMVQTTEENPETSYTYKNCEICATRKTVGPLTDIVHIGSDDPNVGDNFGKFQFIPMPIDTLNHQQEMQQKREYGIRLKTIGYSGEINSQAVNELQIIGANESRRSVNFQLKRNLENLYKWTIETIATLYGIDVDNITISVSWGTDWYLEDSTQLLDQLKEAGDKNLPQSLLMDLYKNYIEAKYQGNTDVVEILDILQILEPMSFTNNANILQIAEKGLLSEKELLLKARFPEFIQMLESEVGDLTKFGNDLEWNERISLLKDELFKIVDNEYSIRVSEKGRDNTIRMENSSEEIEEVQEV